jgi:hypothetical protein
MAACAELNGVVCVGLGQLCIELGDVGVVFCLLRVDALPDLLDVPVPVALNLVPVRGFAHWCWRERARRFR